MFTVKKSTLVSISLLAVACVFNTAEAHSYSKDCGVQFSQHPDRTISNFTPKLVDDDTITNVIRGGEFANVNEMPGLVHLNFYTSITLVDDKVWGGSSESCGGTRISENLILTAGHCVSAGLAAIEITYGTNNRNSSNRGRAFVNDVKCHYGYAQFGGSLYNDIAVIDISGPAFVNLRDNIPPATSIDIETVSHRLSNNVDFTIAGWGSTKAIVPNEIIDNSDPTPFLLKKGEMELVWRGPEKILAEPKGTPPSSICSGDSGGPLYWDDEAGIRQLVGIVSSQSVPRGEEQCERANRALFVNFGSYQDWVNQIELEITVPHEHGQAELGDAFLQSNEPSIDREAFLEDRKAAIIAGKKYTGSMAGFEKLKNDTFKEPGPDGSWIVNGDVAIPTEELLADFYQKGLIAQETIGDDYKLAMDAYNGFEYIWDDIEKKNLTYCVSTQFRQRHSTVVAMMAKAAKEWERYADVKFIYRPEHDTNCNPGNNNVVFDTRPINVEGKYLARAFFPRYARKNRNVLIDYTAFYYRDESRGPTLEGILRHELGHVLGARHEHTRPEAGKCFEDENYVARTNYDKYSVMHYPQCNGFSRSKLHLSDVDKSGIACVYGASPGFKIDPRVCGANAQ